MKPRGARNGMVLLEVIIALSIFALVSLGLVMALHTSFGAAENRDTDEIAARGLTDQLAILQAATITPGERDVEPDASGITYHVSITPAPMQDQKKQPILGMWRATITAHWKENKQPLSREISQLFYQP